MGSAALSSLIMVETFVHRLLRLYDANVSRFVVPSRFVLEKLVEWGWARERFVNIPNFVDVDKDLYKRKGIYPIMHTVAIKKSIYERYPFVATSLYDAFVKSKEIALRKLFNLRAVRYMTPFLMREIDDIWEVFDGDPWPYGVEPNRRTIEALITYQQTLGLTDRAVKVDDLFVPTYG